jgi:hypothetical protein
MNKLWLLILIPILLVGISCVSSDEPAAANSLATKIQALSDTVLKHTSVIDTLRADVDKKATKTEIDDLNRKINNLPQGGSTTGYTKAEVDQKVTDAVSNAITALKNNQDWIKSTGTGGGGTPSDAGTVAYTNNPVSIPQLFSSPSGGNSNPWMMTIKNNSTTWQYVKPMISLNVASGQSQSTVSDVLVMTSGGSCSMTGTYSAGTTTGNFTFSPANMNGSATPSIVAFPISGCNGSGEWYIGPGQTQSYNIQVQGLKTPTATLWNVSCTISSRSM